MSACGSLLIAFSLVWSVQDRLNVLSPSVQAVGFLYEELCPISTKKHGGASRLRSVNCLHGIIEPFHVALVCVLLDFTYFLAEPCVLHLTMLALYCAANVTENSLFSLAISIFSSNQYSYLLLVGPNGADSVVEGLAVVIHVLCDLLFSLIWWFENSLQTVVWKTFSQFSAGFP